MLDVLKRLCIYWDPQLWGDKVTDTNWYYSGLILDYFFDNSVLSLDYLDIEDYFNEKHICYAEDKMLEEQLSLLDEEKYLIFIERILNIFKFSKYNNERSEEILKKSEAYLIRQGFIVLNQSTNPIEVKVDDEIGKGSYCKVTKYTEVIVKKELLKENKEDEKLKKRLKYEFENTKKLCGCPNIISVYDFDDEECSYLMEKAEMDLYEYLKSQVGLSKKEKLKIIYDILKGMKYAHDNNIIHRDLHLGNILKVNDHFVISDFGWSKDISKVRSLKSSSTEKNNHYFMDPLAAGDLTKMDIKTDIYSVGKIIEFIYSYEEEDKLLDFLISKCTSRDKGNRYNSVDEIITDLQALIVAENKEQEKESINNNIKKGILTSKEVQFIKQLLSNGELCQYIVKNSLSNFGVVIVQLPLVEKELVLSNINHGYAEATGYMQFANYDIFGNIAYYVYNHSIEFEIKKISKAILEGCARYRWNMQSLFEKVLSDEI